MGAVYDHLISCAARRDTQDLDRAVTLPIQLLDGLAKV